MYIHTLMSVTQSNRPSLIGAVTFGIAINTHINVYTIPLSLLNWPFTVAYTLYLTDSLGSHFNCSLTYLISPRVYNSIITATELMLTHSQYTTQFNGSLTNVTSLTVYNSVYLQPAPCQGRGIRYLTHS